MRKALAAIVLALPLALLAAPCSAQETSDAKKDEAKALFKQGVGFYKEAKYAQALDKFQKTYDTWPHWRFHLNIGLCYKELSMYLEAKKELSLFLEEGAAQSEEDEANYFAAKKSLVEAALDDLDTIIAVLDVQVMPQGATVKVDGKIVGTSPLDEPVETNPGPHVLEVVAKGYETYREEFFVTEGQQKSFGIELIPLPQQPEVPLVPDQEQPEPEGPTRHVAAPLFWVMGGLTVALAAGAAATGALTVMDHQEMSDLDDEAERARAGELGWSESDWDDYYDDRQAVVDRGKLLGPLTTGLMIAAGAALVGTIVTGVLLHPFAPPGESADSPEGDDDGPPVALHVAPVLLPQQGSMLVVGGTF
jgi:hypothetical protein